MKKTGSKIGPCPDMETLAAYHEHGLKEEEKAVIEKHLVSCDSCMEYLAVLSDGMQSFDSHIQVSAPKRIVDRARNLVRTSEEPDRRKSAFSWFSNFSPLPTLAAASMVLFVALLTTIGLYTRDHKGGNQLALSKFDLVGRVSTGTVTRGVGPVYKELAIKNGGVLHSGDMFKVRFEVLKEGYVYLLGLDSKQHLTRLFPDGNEAFPFKAKANQSYFVPEKDEWFLLDEDPGRERIVMLLSSVPLKGFREKIDQLKQSGFDKINLAFPEAEIRTLHFQHDW